MIKKYRASYITMSEDNKKNIMMEGEGWGKKLLIEY